MAVPPLNEIPLADDALEVGEIGLSSVDLADGEPDELEPAAPEAGQPVDREKLARRMVPFLRIPFRLAAMQLGPHWQAGDDELRPIATDIAEGMPERFLSLATRATHPWVSAVEQLGEMVDRRVKITRSLASMEAPRNVPPPGAGADDRPRPQPAARRPGPGRPGAGGAPAADRGSVAPDDGQGFTFAGLGLDRPYVPRDPGAAD